MAVASLVLGILSLVFSFFSVWVSLVLGIVRIILGVQGRREPDKQGIGTAGLVCSIIGTVISLLPLVLLCTACNVFTTMYGA